MVYTTDWDESSPIDHTKFKVQPSHVRAAKASIAERLKNFFYGFTAGETSEGCKKLTMIVQTTAPSTAADSVQMYAKDVDSVAEWFLKDESANEIQVTSKGKLNSGVFGNYANDTFIKSVDSTGTGTIDLIKGNTSNLPELGAGAVVEGTADPASDYAVATKKYVDDNTAPAGSLQMWAGSLASPPSGWLVCDGSAVDRTTYATLFSAIGTAFGAGDGSTTFNLPNFTNRFPYGANEGADAGNASVGSAGGRTPAGNDGSVTAATSEVAGAPNVSGTGAKCTVTHSHDSMPPYLAVGFIIKT